MKLSTGLAFVVMILGLVANPIHPNYKTRLCDTYSSTGRCRFDEKCQFAHGRDELRNRSNENTKKLEKDQVATTMVDRNKLENHENLRNFEKRIQALEEDLEHIWQLLYRLNKQ